MKKLLMGFTLLCGMTTFPSHASTFEYVRAVTNNTVSMYICDKVNKTTETTCREEAGKYQTLLDERLKTEGIKGSVSVAGVVELTPMGNNCYLIIKLNNSSYSLVKKTEETPRTYKKDKRDQDLEEVIARVSQGPGHVFHTIRNTDGTCEEKNRSKHGKYVDSLHLTPAL